MLPLGAGRKGSRCGEEIPRFRHRLRQAFGRLIRRADDKGVIVLLDRSCPSRLLHGLPPGVLIRRLGLAQAVAETRDFLAEP